ncbi:uncharacterized protein B0J16DRAFT_47371 [Fusarium flagelliforme]|uniref:uncharacterized protein n=1 Tax=Fusarium flagelliforme TaxID=2675880 RepID=UPI001E8EBD72|nr:uncharacterized protein B0J16DRAFT_47371 [Fusarium flagelliforme]KAH7198898.1 hypothetical protein B0J16DRAFT_47371 [Fusarium flagelliforme]
MVPSVLFLVSNMRWTRAGKIDHLALRRCCQKMTRDKLMSLCPAPSREPLRTPTKFIFTEFWERVLACKKESLGCNIDFVHLGGNSLYVIIMVTQLRRHVFQLLIKQAYGHMVSIAIMEIDKQGTSTIRLVNYSLCVRLTRK